MGGEAPDGASASAPLLVLSQRPTPPHPRRSRWHGNGRSDSTLWGAAQSTTTMANWKEDGAARERPFHRVSGRIGAFFGDPRREVDVLSAHVFGYGSDVPINLPTALPSDPQSGQRPSPGR